MVHSMYSSRWRLFSHFRLHAKVTQLKKIDYEYRQLLTIKGAANRLLTYACTPTQRKRHSSRQIHGIHTGVSRIKPEVNQDLVFFKGGLFDTQWIY